MDLINSISVYNGAIIAALITALATSVILYYKNAHSYWKRKGISGPKPLPIFGNALSLFLSKNLIKQELEWALKYGKVYGKYMGKTPILVVADPEVVAQICIKDFDVFPNHVKNELANELNRSFLVALRDDFWRYVRALMSPTFTSGKIKRMFKFMDDCADDLIEVFKEKLEDSKTTALVNVKEVYNLYTFDAITTCCYGMRLERKPGASNLNALASRNDFVAMIMKLFSFSKIRLLTAAMLPVSILRYFQFEINPKKSFEPLITRIKQMIEKRRGSTKKFDDYLQLLIDARLEDDLELDEMDLKENHHASLTKESLLLNQKKLLDQIGNKRTSLSDIEILSNALFLMLVGLETTGSLLSHCTYSLAFHKEIQTKLYEEVMKLAEYDEEKKNYKFNYDTLTSCTYLDSVLSETLRILSPVITFDRQANRDYHIDKYNVDIPEKGQLQLAYYAIHNNPEFWPEPTKFDPERFMPYNRHKIHPNSYVPFGVGPRHCIGMRFSLTEAKLALAKVVANYEFHPAPGTSFPPDPARSSLFLLSLKNPTVQMVPRTKS